MQACRDSFVITGAQVYDGLGTPPIAADVVVRAGKIVAVASPGELNLSGCRRVEASGLSLAPGFIDPHTHSDERIMQSPQADSKISQGVTTDIAGNCGFSPSIILTEETRRFYGGADTITWGDLASYAVELNRREPAINIMALCGHNTVRTTVMGDADRAPTAAELRRMQEIVATALAQGACGLSSGLWYIPGKYSQTDEMMALTAQLRGTGKNYVTHMRNEGDTLIEAVQEAVALAVNGDNRLVISHLKTMYKHNWRKIDRLLETIAVAQQSGLQLTADRYPYTYTGTGLRMVLPPPYCLVSDLPALLASAAERAKLTAVLATPDGPLVSLDKVVICNSTVLPDKRLLGQDLVTIGQALGEDPAALCVRLLASEKYTYTAFGTLCQENLERICAQPWVMCGSDENAYPFDKTQGVAHPRAFGSFPRFFQIVRKVQGSAEAIRRMTSLAALTHRVPERGILRAGYVADLVLFDEESYRDKADFVNSHACCTGVHSVYVNGQLAFTGENPEKRGRFGRFIPVPNANATSRQG